MTKSISIQSIAMLTIMGIMVFFSSCDKNDDVDVDKKAEVIELLSGNNQTGKITKVLSDDIEIIVKDQDGTAFENANISFEAIDGSVSQSSIQTDANGKASVSWTLGETTGTQSLIITAYKEDGTTALTGSPITVTATAICIEIGDEYAGGIVFYINGDCGGLVCAKMDQNNGDKTPWFAGVYTTTGATATEVGSGQANTSAIVLSQGANTNYAAIICDELELEGYNDWFLPSKDELNLMYHNLHQALPAIGNFQTDFYWNSTEDDEGDAWLQEFNSEGSQYFDSKSSSQYIRAVRSF